jgi:hypothetical protein
MFSFLLLLTILEFARISLVHWTNFAKGRSAFELRTTSPRGGDERKL